MTVGQGAPAGNFGAPAAAGWGAPAVHAVQTHGGSGMSPVAEACMRVFNEDGACERERVKLPVVRVPSLGPRLTLIGQPRPQLLLGPTGASMCTSSCASSATASARGR